MKKQAMDYRETAEAFNEKNSVYSSFIDGYEFPDAKLKLKMEGFRSIFIPFFLICQMIQKHLLF